MVGLPGIHSGSLVNLPMCWCEGSCRASQAVELFSIICPEIVVREARLEDRLVAMLSGYYLIRFKFNPFTPLAVIGGSVDDNFALRSEEFKIGKFEWKFSFNREYVAGILTVDTVADFLPRKGPLRQRMLDFLTAVGTVADFSLFFLWATATALPCNSHPVSGSPDHSPSSFLLLSLFSYSVSSFQLKPTLCSVSPFQLKPIIQVATAALDFIVDQ
uniref:Uncharacterized protein n=1 Tax=Nelumbo nucifera TaxID=4432 RepID=A0A822YY82_NELNU|nr:TPA_asm: hypothetical protein HUJ06_008148 [Nelumbo nucifera]